MDLLPLAGALLAALCCFARVVWFGYLNWDDYDLLVDNPGLHAKSLASLRQFWTAPYRDLFTPLAYTWWWGIAKVADHPAAYHAGNLLLHLLCVALVFALLRALGAGPMNAGLGALVFAVHPIQVETVAWISGMNNLLAAGFSLASLCCYVRSGSQRQHRHAIAARRWYFAATLLFLAALLSKPTAVVTPLMAFGLDLLQRRPLRKSLTLLAPWLAGAAIFGVIAHVAQPARDVPFTPTWQRPIEAIGALWFYLGQIVRPRDLTVDYGLTPARLLQAPGMWIGVIGAGLCAAGWLIAPRQVRRPIGSIALVFIAGMLPTLGLTPFSFQRLSTVADRYAYLSMLAIAIAVSRVRRPWLMGAVMLWLALLVPTTLAQVAFWHDDTRLFTENLRINPASVPSMQVLGYDAAARGDRATAFAYDMQGLALDPNNPVLNFAMGNLFLHDDPAAALPYYQIAEAGRPGEAKIWNNFGVALARLGHRDEAIAQFRQAIALRPDWPDPRDNLARLQLAK